MSGAGLAFAWWMEVLTGQQADGTAVALTLAFVGAVAGAVAFQNERIAAADTRLDKLMEMNADDHPEQCIEYDNLRENPDVERYQQAIQAMGRKPVVAEYRAAKVWVDTQGDRESQADKVWTAQVACERMSAT